MQSLSAALRQQWRRLTRRKPAPARQTPRDQALVYHTGHDSVYWVGRIQDMIKVWFDAEPENPHPHCNPAEWLTELVKEVEAARIERYGDENIQMAVVLATILATWGIRLGRTKAYDPRRPVAIRQNSLETVGGLQAILFDAITNETQDPAYFYLPRWDNPFDPEAVNGDFV